MTAECLIPKQWTLTNLLVLVFGPDVELAAETFSHSATRASETLMLVIKPGSEGAGSSC